MELKNVEPKKDELHQLTEVIMLMGNQRYSF